MSNGLVSFGQLSKSYRIAKKVRIADQAEALNVKSYEISAYETGEKIPPQSYVDKLAAWLSLDFRQKALLLRSIRSAVVIDLKAEKKKREETVRLFRRIHKMTPSEIRGIRPKPRGSGNER